MATSNTACLGLKEPYIEISNRCLNEVGCVYFPLTSNSYGRACSLTGSQRLPKGR